jgi:hypothetical protein
MIISVMQKPGINNKKNTDIKNQLNDNNIPDSMMNNNKNIIDGSIDKNNIIKDNNDNNKDNNNL